LHFTTIVALLGEILVGKDAQWSGVDKIGVTRVCRLLYWVATMRVSVSTEGLNYLALQEVGHCGVSQEDWEALTAREPRHALCPIYMRWEEQGSKNYLNWNFQNITLNTQVSWFSPFARILLQPGIRQWSRAHYVLDTRRQVFGIMSTVPSSQVM
jgi:hypothetical protein